jgi:Protein of unknown function (DUF2950)
MSRLSRDIATILVAGAMVAAAGCARRAAEDANQMSFATADEATAAFVAALEKHDVVAMRRLLGLGSKDILSSGDTADDRADREAFLARYRMRHQLVAGGPDDLILQVGEDDWPLPVPLLRRNGRWRFDGDAAVHELQVRRIGANELRTIDMMRGFVAAQEEYAAVGHDAAAPGIYARTLRSEPGRQNGLYWEVAAGEAPSPAGPFLAGAAAEGFGTSQGASTPAPYHGYVYRMLFSQGPAASGGAQDYVVDGKLTRGFALLARPAEYGKTGVMTFMVSQDGVVWQRDLGPRTTELAAAITQFNPDSTWTPIAADEEGQTPR